ncbi:unnamed protein product [Microthlaspi erraticum]|uniref:Uncharacterized protein n=1 Tax=Microthlaspi erraticum TaxID=1685480 RepID=A0A6D2HGE0_9BRAS|nr:unnamed protein product [Microthlaspi erraticum]
MKPDISLLSLAVRPVEKNLARNAFLHFIPSGDCAMGQALLPLVSLVSKRHREESQLDGIFRDTIDLSQITQPIKLIKVINGVHLAIPWNILFCTRLIIPSLISKLWFWTGGGTILAFVDGGLEHLLDQSVESA